MKTNISWKYISNVNQLTHGILLSATDSCFTVTDIQANTLLLTLSFNEFISEYCKYPSEIFANIAGKVTFECDHIFFDNLSDEKIGSLCESNCLLF